MMVTMYGPSVRIRHSMHAAVLYVEVRRPDDSWAPLPDGAFNEAHNGLAHKQAAALAMATRRKLIEGENV